MPLSSDRPSHSEFDVAIVGGGVAGLFAARELAQAGCRVGLVHSADPESDAEPGVLWPGLSEHWGVLREALGDETCAAFQQVRQRSGELLQGLPVRPGAVSNSRQARRSGPKCACTSAGSRSFHRGA